MTIPLADAARHLKEKHGVITTYRQIYTGVLDGRFPASRVNGRWQLDDSVFPMIARELAGGGRPTAASEPAPAAA